MRSCGPDVLAVTSENPAKKGSIIKGIAKCDARGFISFSEVANVPGQQGDQLMARAKKRRAWTTQDVRALKTHSKNKTSVKAISRTMKRTPAALRQKAQRLGIALGHRR